MSGVWINIGEKGAFTMSVEEYRQRITMLSDSALRRMVYEEFQDYEPEAIEVARTELALRNRYISQLGDGDTVTLNELIYKLDIDECMNELKKLNKKADIDFYYEFLANHSQMPQGQDTEVLINFIKSKTGAFEIFGSDMKGVEKVDLEDFHYTQWFTTHIKKSFIFINGKELVVALCLLKMTLETSDKEIHNNGKDIINTCPNCGATCEPNVKFCGKCGYQQSWEQTKANPIIKPNINQIFCLNCGTKLLEGQKFCTKCGTKLIQNSNNEVSEEKKWNYSDKTETIAKSHSIKYSQRKKIKTILAIIGGILVLIGIIKVSIIGYYPKEAPLYFGIIVLGGICAYISTKIKLTNEDDEA